MPGVSLRDGSVTVTRLHAKHSQLVDRICHHLDAPGGEGHTVTVLSAFFAQSYTERDLPDTVAPPEHPDDEDVIA